MHISTRCITLAIGILAGLRGQTQPARTDTFVLHFAFDRSEIRPADTAALHRFLYQTGGIDSIVITGYTDTVGSPEYNQRLSDNRALAAARVIQHGLATDMGLPMHVEGRGESESVPGDDSQSRRVTIVCWHDPTPPPPVVVQLDTPRNISEPDTVFELNDINFYANTANLTDVAQMALPKYISYLLTLKSRYLEVDGYCNSPGPLLKPSDPLYILSVKRAKFIYDYLIEKGFSPERLSYKGRGNTNPRKAHPTTREEMDKNMRVEIKVYRSKPEP